ncbi:MAG: hypothetical protein JWN78_820 [Bacteroidota bacterium]|nr:hypothetical protein [Bacteroidota bacterium]
MKQMQLSTTAVVNDDLESYLTTLQERIINSSKLQGKQDGLRLQLLLLIEYKINCIDSIKSTMQDAIHEIKAKLQPVSKLSDVNEIRIKAKDKISQLQRDINDLQQKQLKLENECNALFGDAHKRRNAKLVVIAAIAMATADGLLAFTSFKLLYPQPIALVGAATLSICIFAGHNFGAWLRAAQTKMQFIRRLVLIIGGSMVLFAMIGILRSTAQNSQINLSITDEVSPHTTASVSGWAIAAISEILFCTILFVSTLFHRSKKERQQDEAYEAKCCEAQKNQKAIADTQAEMNRIESDAMRQSQEARARYYACIDAISRCKSIAQSGIVEYKKSYLNAHAGTIPEFFNTDDALQFDDELNNYSSQNTQA